MATLPQISHKRLWRACNLKFLSHRVLFIRHNARYDNIIWQCPGHNDDFWAVYTKIFRLFEYYRNYSEQIDIIHARHVLQAISILFGATPRQYDLYLACGIKAMPTALVDEQLDKLFNDLFKARPHKDKNLFDELITLEYISPYNIRNSNIARVFWNICRISAGLPFAFIPWENKDAYWQRVVEHGHATIISAIARNDSRIDKTYF